ncbi:metal ABC transporter permease [Elioraea thermophila]|uniref:metal ABC transporter permease n=1 Tax=Elioraea thermophila TaxID=2185104 RepID=UPI000DF1541E|nr:metal ABC transporter permease [Elioraea thermophila]
MMMGLIEPFLEFSFLRRALAGGIALALSAPPLGVFLVQRRLSLIGDALGHAILPGVALGAALFGLSLAAMSGGGLLAGLVVMLAAGLAARGGALREDASLAGFYLVSLALGVAIVSWGPAQLDLLELLFGSVLAVDDAALLLMAGTATVTLVSLAMIWRPLVIETFDAGFLRAQGGRGALWHLWFLALVVLNLVAAFQALGTLMAVGLMMLPAVAARFVSPTLSGQVVASVGIAVLAVLGGLIVSVRADVPTGPAIVLCAGALWLALLLAGPEASVLARSLRRPHLAR